MQAETMELAEASELVHIVGEESRTTSLLVANKFGKEHKNVLWVIDHLGCPEVFTQLNFKLSEYEDSTGRKLKMYELTRDGFTLLVMGFTGKKVMEWKINYIKAFNRMEQEIRRLAIQKGMASGTLPPGFAWELLSEDRISQVAIKPDGTTTLTLRRVYRKALQEERISNLKKRILGLVKRLKSPTLREITRYNAKAPRQDIQRCLDELVAAGKIEVRRSSRTTRWTMYQKEGSKK